VNDWATAVFMGWVKIPARAFSCLRLGLRHCHAAFFFLALTLSIHAASSKHIKVVATILPAYCFAVGVVGTNGDVQLLLPPNVEPHDYQLSPSDLRKIKEADLIVYNGLGLDNWIVKAIPTRARALELGSLFTSELIPLAATDLEMRGPHKHAHDHQHGPANPHIWLDPQLAIRCVLSIVVDATKLDRANATAFANNASAYTERLKALDAEIAEVLAPVRDTPFISQHDAFPYFNRHFNLKQVGVIELIPDTPPSPRYLNDLMKVAREKKVPVIFNLPPAPPRLIKQIAKDLKIRVAELKTLESGSPTPDAYEFGMRTNAKVLRKELAK
jgi:zinc transport system substrate-binding protein